MAEAARGRRSSRRKSVPSYRIKDAFQFLDEDDEDGGDGTGAGPSAQQDNEEEEDTFMPDEQEEEQEDESVDGDDVADEDEDEDAYSEDEVLPRGESIIDIDNSENELSSSTRRLRLQQKTISTAAAASLPKFKPPQPRTLAKEKVTRVHTKASQPDLPDKKHARGVDEWGRGLRGAGQENRLKDLFGPSLTDLKPVLQSRDWWLPQDTLPSREEGSLRRSFYVSEEAMKKETTNTSDWYSNSGAEAFAQGQRTKILNKDEAAPYLFNAGPKSLNLLMGALADQQLHTLSKGSHISTAAPFASKENRRGWLINLGSRVRDAQFAPNEDGITQYLAVAVEQKQTEGRVPAYLENPQAPAFSVTPKFPASIQIWAFEATEDGNVDTAQSPRLELVICTNWGAPKQLKWCPIAVADTVKSSQDDHIIHLGLLASIWSDGKVRILDVSYTKPQSDDSETVYLQYTQAAFQTHPQHTIPTCLYWLSGTSLAVGTAAGMLGVWTLTRPDTFPTPEGNPDQQHNPQPWFYRQVADTFMITLASGWPSRPTYISFTTADGFSTLIDLRSPKADAVKTSRGRIFAMAQAWHEHTQSFVMADEAYLLRHNTVRRYYSNILSMRSEAQIACIATSPVHPGVMIGCADGSAIASNPIPRILNAKEVPWQQTWFVHEWRRPVDELTMRVQGSAPGDRPEEDESTPSNNETDDSPAAVTNNTNDISPDQEQSNSVPLTSKVPPRVLAQPLARFTEGYRVQMVNLAPVRPGGDKHTKDFIKSITIFEECTAITTLAWNPNLKFGTWAVAGMGDGLLRVEDLGV